MLASQSADASKSPIPVSLPVGGWLMGNTGETAPVEPMLLKFWLGRRSSVDLRMTAEFLTGMRLTQSGVVNAQLGAFSTV
jgi:hypothetical protein